VANNLKLKTSVLRSNENYTKEIT